MDGFGASGRVDQTRLLEYCVRATGAYAQKLTSEYNLSTNPNLVSVVVRTEANWRAPMQLAAEAEPVVSLRCPRIGTSSYVLEYEIRQADRLVAELMETFVVVNTQTGRPEPVPDDLRAAFLEDHQAQGIAVA